MAGLVWRSQCPVLSAENTTVNVIMDENNLSIKNIFDIITWWITKHVILMVVMLWRMVCHEA